MKILYALLLMGFVLINSQAQKSEREDEASLKLVQTISMPDVVGRIDHLDVDIKGKRLFVAALGNNTVEVLDLNSGKVIHTIKGLHEPQGVSFIPEFNRIYVSNSEDGTCEAFDASSFNQIQKVNFSNDADNMRYDGAAKKLYVGFGDGALGIIDVTNGRQVGDIKLKGHPESFQLEQSGHRIYVNVPSAGHVAVVDREKGAIEKVWPIRDARANFPLALDESNHRLFVGCRNPPTVLVLDTTSGGTVARLNSTGDVDDIFFDGRHKRIYLSGGEGFIYIFDQLDANSYKLAGKISTARGARTSLLVSELGRFFLAVPHHGSRPAEIRVYEF